MEHIIALHYARSQQDTGRGSDRASLMLIYHVSKLFRMEPDELFCYRRFIILHKTNVVWHFICQAFFENIELMQREPCVLKVSHLIRIYRKLSKQFRQKIICRILVYTFITSFGILRLFSLFRFEQILYKNCNIPHIRSRECCW